LKCPQIARLWLSTYTLPSYGGSKCFWSRTYVSSRVGLSVNSISRLSSPRGHARNGGDTTGTARIPVTARFDTWRLAPIQSRVTARYISSSRRVPQPGTV
jgi:hypothetical protein